MFWSKRTICSGRSPCRAAISAVVGAQTYGVKPLGSRSARAAVADRSARRGRAHAAASTTRASSAAACSGSPSARASGPTTLRAAATPSALGPHDLERLQERLEPEPAGGPRETACRQHVGRARRVVADDRGRADEHRAGIANPAEQRLGIGDEELEMLGRVGLGPHERLVE